LALAQGAGHNFISVVVALRLHPALSPSGEVLDDNDIAL